jgi:hypothetical protein
MILFFLLFFIIMFIPDQDTIYPYNLYYFHVFYFICLLKSFIGILFFINKIMKHNKIHVCQSDYIKKYIYLIPSIFVSLIFLLFSIYVYSIAGLKKTIILSKEFINHVELNIIFLIINIIGLPLWVSHFVFNNIKKLRCIDFLLSVLTPLSFLFMYIGRLIQFMN